MVAIEGFQTKEERSSRNLASYSKSNGPLFRAGASQRIFTKLLKVPISIIRRLNIRLIIYLEFGRCAIEGSVDFRIANSKGHIILPLSTSRTDYKPKEVSFDTLAKNRILGTGSRFSGNDLITSSREF